MKNFKLWLLILLALLMFGTFFDYQISSWQETINQNILILTFYRFFEIFGEFAFMLAFVIMFSFFANFGYRKKGVVRIFQFALNSIGLLVFSYLQFITFARYLQPEGGNSNGEVTNMMILVSIILAICLSLIMFKLMFKITSENYKYYRKIVLVSILYVILLVFIINILKVIWARPRYWLVASGEATFVPWYIVNGNDISNVTNAYMSFPSGHTANAFSSIYLSLWFVKKRSLVINMCLAWGVLTAISRIFASQHYLSDTIMSGIITLSLFIVIIKLFNLSPKIDRIVV